MRSDWQSYVVQPGDNLLFVARAINSTVYDIQEGNCYEPIRSVFVGETVLLPQLPNTPIQIVEPVLLSEGMNTTPIGCLTGDTQILMPQSLESVQGIFAVLGTARSADFAYYKIEIRPEWSDVYSLYLKSDVPVEGDLIGLVNTEVFGTGVHRLRLTVVTINDQIAENGVCEIPLLFTAP